MNEGVSKVRLYVIIAAIGLTACGITARLVYLQVVKQAYFATVARRQANERVEVDAPRATLLDRNGVLLAASVMGPSLYTFDPQKISDPVALSRAVSTLGARKSKLILNDLRTRNRFTWLSRKLSFKQYPEAEAIVARFPGVRIMDEPVRFYPNGKLAANLIGCMGTDGGLSGLENQWNKELAGGKRHFMVMRDAVSTRLISTDLVSMATPTPRAVRLTIDAAIQNECEDVLSRTVSGCRAKDGVAIVLNCRNGDILAMAVTPTFDPNHPREYPPASWRNRAITDSFAPGSTMKVVTLAAALDSGKFAPGDTVVVGNGTLKVGAKTIHDDEPPLKPVYSLEEVLVHSSNVGAAKIGIALGSKTFYHYLRLFGFGKVSQPVFSGEVPGLLRPPQEWTRFSLPYLSFGQEMRATPLQLVSAFADIAAGGFRVVPRIFMDAPQHSFKRIIKASTAKELTRMMIAVVGAGTGRAASIPGVLVAGKTGTAQKLGVRDPTGRKLYVAYFVGFAPAANPRLVLLVMVDEPMDKIYGAAAAAPAFAKIMGYALKRTAYPETTPRTDLAYMGKQP